ncbi:MAG: type VI secretion system tip protein VgrG [Proteobacteria bacterium]|nr:type VI secretion system tip protein VgrG [Pseudomonadota bacterium]
MSSIRSEIYGGGSSISSNIVSVNVVSEVNRIPYAQLVLTDVDATDTNNKRLVDLSNDDKFKPGAEFELALNQGDDSGVFKGIVVKQKVRKNQSGSFLTVEIKDASYKLCSQRKSAVFNEKDDCQIIKDIAGKKDIKVTCSEQTYVHKQIVQYYCSDWDFIISRAEANGLMVFVENGELIIKKPDYSDAADDIGDVYDFEMEADAGGQYQEVESVFWDIKNVALTTSLNNNSSDLESGLDSQHSFSGLSGAMGADKYQLVNGVHSEAEEMELWANSGMMKNRLSMLRGRITIDGNPSIKLGKVLTLNEVGNVFSSKAMITGIRHRISKDGWKTDLQLGLPKDWFHKKADVVEAQATGLLPGIHGLQVGIVEAFPSDGDPDGFHRIKVRIPAVHESESVLWARLLFPYAGADRGVFFIPEEGDEVVIGFFNDDPRHAVVIGSLYNGQTEPPLEFTDVNNEKGIVTRNGMKIVFTDEDDKEIMELSTPGGNQVLMEDENGIKVVDKNENSVTFHDKGVELVDKNDNKFILDDKGIIAEDTNKNSITASKQGIEIKDSNGNTVTLSDAGIEIADMNGNKAVLEAGGVTIEAGASMTLKGATIDIN